MVEICAFWTFVAPATDRFNMALGEVLEDPTDVQVFFDGCSEEFETRIAGEFLHFVTVKECLWI